jgi:hypothetical protein
LVGSLLALAVCAGGLLADEVKGKVKSVDPDKGTITVTADDKDQTLDVAKDAKVIHLVGKKLKKAKVRDVPGGLGGVKAGDEVTLTTEAKGGRSVVSQVKVEGLAPKKKKNK